MTGQMRINKKEVGGRKSANFFVPLPREANHQEETYGKDEGKDKGRTAQSHQEGQGAQGTSLDTDRQGVEARRHQR